MSACAQFPDNATRSNRDLAIAASEVANPKSRNEIDAGHMTMILLATCDAVRDEPQALGTLAEMTARWARPLVARGDAVIDSAVKHTAAPPGAAPQGALFDREIEPVFRA